MPVSEEFRTFIADQLAGLGPVDIRRMFGGAGVFLDGIMFAIIDGEALYLKVDDSNRAAFEAAGMKPFTYNKAGKATALSYWEAPERLYDDPDEMAEWARAAHAAALRSRSAKKPKRAARK